MQRIGGVTSASVRHVTGRNRKSPYLRGYFLLGVGVAGILFVVSARIWGKRHLFLLGTILFVACSSWLVAAEVANFPPKILTPLE